MATYYWGADVTWEQYLQTNAFVQDINKTIRKNGKETRQAISTQTQHLIASHEALSRNFQSAFDAVNGTLAEGFGIIGEQIASVNRGIEDLGVSFEYGMGLLAEQLSMQNELLGGLLQRLDAIHHTLQTPTLTQAREFFNIGKDRINKGLIDKALEAFLKAEDKNDADFLTQYALGEVYLYGRDDVSNLIDLAKAEQHFKQAGRYAKAEMVEFPEARIYCGKAYFYASLACYVHANEQRLTGAMQEVNRLLQDASNLAQRATDIYPELIEGFYHYAKTCALSGQVDTAIQSLDTAIKADRNYCLKVDGDRDFDTIRSQVIKLFERLQQQAKEHVQKQLVDTHYLIENYVFSTSSSQRTKQQIEQCIDKAQSYNQNGTYFDYLDAVECLMQAKKYFDKGEKIDKQEFEAQQNQERLKRKEEEREKQERKKALAESRKMQEKCLQEEKIRSDRAKAGLCINCGAKLSFFDKFGGQMFCSKCRG